MKNYTHLTQEKRYYIYVSLQSKISLRTIASSINRSVSSISRELKRNRGKAAYRYKQANEMAKKRQSDKVKAKFSLGFWEQIKTYICKQYSPEQISGYFEYEFGLKISHESIYTFIHKDKKAGGFLYKNLRCQRVKKRRYAKLEGRGQIQGRVFIDERPEIVSTRSRIGDWEADLVESKKGEALFVTLTERKTRLNLWGKVSNKKAKNVSDKIIEMLTPIKDFVHTITFDNGKEFAYHKSIADKLEAKTYFAKPYHPYERGTNENANGLLRQYFPKGKSIKNLTNQTLAEITIKVNQRPRKCLGYNNPFQAFIEEMQSVALSI